jgi:hypothetical protein
MALTKTPPVHRPPPSGAEGRGYVSPLGGATAPFATDLQKRQERLNRAQSAIPPELRGRNDRGPDQPNMRGSAARTNHRR